VLDIAMPYLGPVVGVYSDWTPLEGRGKLYPEDVDWDDPWQFKNFRVV
jgi:homospermidine synthase